MSEWDKTTLGQVCSFKGGNAFPQEEQGSRAGAAPFIKVSDLSLSGNDSTISRANNWVSETQISSLRLSLFPAGSSVFAKIGEGMKSERVRRLTIPTAIDNNLMAAVPAPTTDPRFLYYLLQTVRLASHAVGSALPYLKQSTLQAVPVVIPKRPDQQAIAEVLGALDDKIAANTALAGTATRLASMEFAAAVHDASWGPTFDEIAAVNGGGTPSTKNPMFWDGDISWATPTDMTALVGPYLESTTRSITPAGLAACSSKLFNPGAILMTSRATIGALAVNGVPTAVNQGFIVVEPHNPRLRWWLFHEMESRIEEFISWANGATFLELSRGNFRRLRVRTPSKGLLAGFDSRVSSLHEAARAALVQNGTLAATRDTLLPQLMAGKLRVRDVEAAASEAGV
ncbi:restriction endonuclease subunit S [Microbacterium schleiferi]|jgi:type I restriction enzyme, S subunit|uniref:restriction endonuclease subunit S n=1 Tax=Microbacterium schleiferi TaxID=69362 RepID=UPI00311DFE2B